MTGWREPLPLMTPAQRADYAGWLLRITKARKGQLPERLRQAAKEIREGEFV